MADARGLLQSAPHIGPLPILINVPAFAIVMLITWLLVLGVRESARANNIMVAIKLIVLALFLVMGATHINTANYHPFAPNGFTGIHQGAAIVFFAYIGFDAISTAAEETRLSPLGVLQANCKRLQEALRSLEEFGKLKSPDLGQAIEELRYRSYTLEKALVLGGTARPNSMPAKLWKSMFVMPRRRSFCTRPCSGRTRRVKRKGFNEFSIIENQPSKIANRE